jgi:hypothetical protein
MESFDYWYLICMSVSIYMLIYQYVGLSRSVGLYVAAWYKRPPLVSPLGGGLLVHDMLLRNLLV